MEYLSPEQLRKVQRSPSLMRDRIQKIILEWCSGCSVCMPGAPETCHECTKAAIKAIARIVDLDECELT